MIDDPAAEPKLPRLMRSRLKRVLFGAPRDLHDPSIGHKISLVAFLAWVGLGADGLSSSAYGPEEAFKALLEKDATYLAFLLAVATGLTVFIISYTYSRIIEHFPFGGGGYVVATKLLGPRAGVVSGSALLVDYALTIATSVASGADALWSLIPEATAKAPIWGLSHHHQLVNGVTVYDYAWGGVHLKVAFELLVIFGLIVMNLRGVKESVLFLMPIFMVFVLSHVIFIVGAVAANGSQLPAVWTDVTTGLGAGVSKYTLAGLLLIFARAYSLGGGTYTGIEAVSNGIAIMREPRVQTAKRTMVYMAVSLAEIGRAHV